MKAIRTEEDVQNELLRRRQFLTTGGVAGLTAATLCLMPTTVHALMPEVVPKPPLLDNASGDTAEEILTSALVAEDLATTVYYNGLRGRVIQDPALAGAGGTANRPSVHGNPAAIGYLKAALVEEAAHATLFRSMLGSTLATNDPVQTFYLPTGTFDNLSNFTTVLDALENALIGTYLAATIEFAQMACDSIGEGVRQQKANGAHYGVRELQWLSQLSASILGVECEHRVLGRDLVGAHPPNQLKYAQADTIKTVANGSASAMTMLAPFLSPGAGMTGYSFHQAASGVQSFAVPVTGGLPVEPHPRSDGK